MDSSDEHRPPESDFTTELAERLRTAPTDERVYRIALELYDPTQVSEVATRADCSKNAARRHLRRLTDIGLLTRVTDNPATFERNESYFEWRRLNRLAELDADEYNSRLEELLSEETAYRDRFDAAKPAEVDPLEYDDPEQIWLELNNWAAIRTEIRDLRRSRRDEPATEGVA